MFMGVGSAIFLAGQFFFWTGVLRAYRVVRLPGRLVAYDRRVETDESGSLTFHYPVVEFVDTDDQDRRVTLSQGAIRPNIKVGAKVYLNYDPAHPMKVEMAAFGNLGCAPMIGGFATFMGAMAFLIGLLMWLYGKPE